MWDRFDDAMDDMADDIRQWNAEIDRLLKKLEKKGITPPPRPEKPGPQRSTNDSGAHMNSAYGAETGYWNEVSDYLDKLKKLLDDAD